MYNNNKIVKGDFGNLSVCYIIKQHEICPISSKTLRYQNLRD